VLSNAVVFLTVVLAATLAVVVLSRTSGQESSKELARFLSRQAIMPVIAYLFLCGLLPPFLVAWLFTRRKPSKLVVDHIIDLAMLFVGSLVVSALLVNANVTLFRSAFVLAYGDPSQSPDWLRPWALLVLALAMIVTLGTTNVVAFDVTGMHVVSRIRDLGSMLFEISRARRHGIRLTDWELPGALPTAKASDVRFLCISDTHVSDGGSTLEKHGISDAQLGENIGSWLGETRAHVLVHGGDITDLGTDAQFNSASAIIRDAVSRRPGLACVAVPGNHDIHYRYAEHRGFAMPATHTPTRTAERIERMMPGARDGVLEGYPALSTFRTSAGTVRLLLLDSNRRTSSSWITNGLGLVGDPQLSRARELVGPERDTPLLIVLHHHVGFLATKSDAGPEEPRKENGSIRDNAIVCVDGHKVVDFAHEVGALAIIHGHRHMPYVAQHSQTGHTVKIVSCGSARYPGQGPFSNRMETPSAMVVDVDPRRRVLAVSCLAPAASAVAATAPESSIDVAHRVANGAEHRLHDRESLSVIATLFRFRRLIEPAILVGFFWLGMRTIELPVTESLGAAPSRAPLLERTSATPFEASDVCHKRRMIEYVMTEGGHRSPVTGDECDTDLRREDDEQARARASAAAFDAARLREVERYLSPLCPSHAVALRHVWKSRNRSGQGMEEALSVLEELVEPVSIRLSWRASRLVSDRSSAQIQERLRERDLTILKERFGSSWGLRFELALRRMLDGAPDPVPWRCKLRGDPLRDPPL
jgi:predicted phosphodiesterase